MGVVDRLQRALATARVLWAALVMSNVILLVLTVVLPSSGRAQWAPPQLVTFAFVALGMAVASFIVPARMATTGARSRPPATLMEQVPAGEQGSLGYAGSSAVAGTALALGQTAFILSMALSEAVTLFGFALHMTGAPLAASLPLCLAGTALGALRFPTLAGLVGPYEKAHGFSFAAGGRPPTR